MKQFFLALFIQLQTIRNEDGSQMFKKIAMWNNQLTLLIDKNGARTTLFEMPGLFIAFNTASIQQLGNGVQLYDPLFFDIHILDWQIDAGDGTFEQNLEVFDRAEKVYQCIQKFQPGLTDTNDPAGSCIRVAEEEDTNHNGVYHFIQRYKTTFVDNNMAEPVGGIDWLPVPMPLELQMFIKNTIDKCSPYDPTKQYLAVNLAFVSNDDKYYVIKTDTPNPAGVFDPTKWTLLDPQIYNFTPTP